MTTRTGETPTSLAEALHLLRSLGAHPHLVQHHRLVSEAAREICVGLDAAGLGGFDRSQVEIGAALHDVGKVAHPNEMQGPGNQHERDGHALLIERGVEDRIARHAWMHAAWREIDQLEPLLVALADTLWKGKRIDELEHRVVQRLAERFERDLWDVWEPAVAVFDAGAAHGDARIARSTEYVEQ